MHHLQVRKASAAAALYTYHLRPNPPPRRRRVKCDETRPSCIRCQTGNRTCGGYGIIIDVPARTTLKRLSPEEEELGRDIRPKSWGPRPSSSLGGIVFDSQSESFAFELFRSQTVLEMAGIRSAGFWKDIVLPACHIEPAVLHSAMALASAGWRDAGPPGKRVPGPLDNGVARIHTVVEYNRAIEHLKTHVAHPTSASSLNVTLIVCIMFVALELRTGRYVEAMVHFNQGVRLLVASENDPASAATGPEAETGTVVLSSDPQTPKEEFIRIFADLDLQMAYVTHKMPELRLVPRRTTGNAPLLPCPRPPSYMDLPDSFGSIEEATQHVMILTSECRAFISQKYSLYGGSPEDALAVYRRVQLCGYLDRWRALYDQLCLRLGDAERAAPGWDQHAAFALIQHAWLRVTVPTSHVEVEETEYDAHLGDFATIVDRASRILGEGTPRSRFSLEGGIVPALAWTAGKCRHRRIRHEAIRLLGLAGREGLWDPRLVGQLAQGCVQLEEEGDEEAEVSGVYVDGFSDWMSPGSDDYWNQMVPAHRRVTDATVELEDDNYEEIILMFTRKKWSENGEFLGMEQIVRRQPFKTS